LEVKAIRYWLHVCTQETTAYVVQHFNFIYFSCYSMNNIIQFILSGIIPNEICRNDTYKVLKGIWQAKPWALRSKY